MTIDRTNQMNSHDYLKLIIGIFTTGFNNYSKTAMCRSVMISKCVNV